MDSLRLAVQKACPPGLWSQGVGLAREGSVVVDKKTPSEVVARVRAASVTVAPTVVLYVQDGEWACDCGSKFDPCQHVAAAVIFITQSPTAAAAGTNPQNASSQSPAKPALGKLEYQFSRLGGEFFIERVVVFPDGHDEPFTGSATNRVTRGDLPFLPTHEDLAIDRMMSTWKGGVVPPAKVRELFALLETADAVLLDGCPMRTSKEAVRPRALVLDGKNGGVLVRLQRDSAVEEVVARGVARMGEVLCPIENTPLTGESWEKLPLERTVAKEELGTFVTKILPDLDKHTRLSVRTRRLPGIAKRSRPRIAMELSQVGHTLSVLPLLVYGDPPEARVDNNVLVHLQGTVPARDEAEERRLKEHLRNELNLVPGRRVDLDGEAALRFAQKLKSFRGGEQGETFGEMFGSRPLSPRFEISGDSFDVVFEWTSDEGEASGAAPKRALSSAVMKAWQDGLDIVPLEGGGFAPLPMDWLSRYGEKVADLLSARMETEDQTIPPALLPALARLCEELDAPKPPGLAKLKPLLADFSEIPESKIPTDVTATLRVYQKRGVDWLSFLRDAGLGGILADDMGLGKTLQALVAAKGRTLVVCPKSVLFNWEAEIRKFRPGLTISLYHGPKRALVSTADITLTTYAMLRMDVEALSAIEWDTIVLDEAQAIKNPDSQVARAAYTMRGKFKVALSGTPVENRLEELWSQMHFANRGLLGGRSDFKARHATPIESGEQGAAARLREKIRPFVLRRLKREVAPELPPRTERVLSVELDEKERAVYDAVRAATLPSVVKRLAEGGSVLEALEALLRLRQASCHSALVPGQVATGSSKVEALCEALADAAADGHKALVFSQWTSLLDLVEPHLVEAGISFNRLDGSTVDRGAVVSAFQAEGGPSVMLLSLKAGGTGLNLTAADHVFLLDPWWNPAAEDQAADRAHRIGQDKPVFVYRFVAKDTVEERILALQEKKRAVADAALGEAGKALSITRDDLMSLFA